MSVCICVCIVSACFEVIHVHAHAVSSPVGLLQSVRAAATAGARLSSGQGFYSYIACISIVLSLQDIRS